MSRKKMSETPKKFDNYQFIIVLFSSCEEPSIRKVKLFLHITKDASLFWCIS